MVEVDRPRYTARCCTRPDRTNITDRAARPRRISGTALTRTGARLTTRSGSVAWHPSGCSSMLIRTTVFDARDRRAYEQELLSARQVAAPRLRAPPAPRRRSAMQPVTGVAARTPGTHTAAFHRMASPDEGGGDFRRRRTQQAGRRPR